MQIRTMNAVFSAKTLKIVGSAMLYAVTLILLMILLSGCAGGSGQGVDVCGPWKPIYPGATDVFTDGTARQILAHNEVGERLCNWRAPQ